MTEQEAEGLAARLTRIWEIDDRGLHWELDTTGQQWGFDDVFVFVGQVVGGVKFRHFQDNVFRISSDQSNTMIDCSRGIISVSQARIGRSMMELCPQFAAQWMPFFRRGCWLSGCAIEASAHEKAEWMQGFTREELDAWNLKM